MALRFPLSEAPDHSARESVEDSISLVHNGVVGFPIIRDDGQAMLGPFGPVRYYLSSAFILSLTATWYSVPEPTNIADDLTLIMKL